MELPHSRVTGGRKAWPELGPWGRTQDLGLVKGKERVRAAPLEAPGLEGFPVLVHGLHASTSRTLVFSCFLKFILRY